MTALLPVPTILFFIKQAICSFNFSSPMIVSSSWFSLSCFVFPFLVFVLVFVCACVYVCVCLCLSAAVLSVLWSAWWGLWAEALVVQKSGSSSLLAEGKPESCGKMLLREWLVWQLASIHASDPGVKLPLISNRATAMTFSIYQIYFNEAAQSEVGFTRLSDFCPN